MLNLDQSKFIVFEAIRVDLGQVAAQVREKEFRSIYFYQLVFEIEERSKTQWKLIQQKTKGADCQFNEGTKNYGDQMIFTEFYVHKKLNNNL